MRHNNKVPDIRGKKDRSALTKVNFDQPLRKQRRHLKRVARAKKIYPRPLHNLHPGVHSCSFKHNSKVRLGRGFSLTELKMAGIKKAVARTIGISFDHRRKNRTEEGITLNVGRLRSYKSRILLLEKPTKKVGVKRHLPPIGKDGKVRRLGKAEVDTLVRAAEKQRRAVFEKKSKKPEEAKPKEEAGKEKPAGEEVKGAKEGTVVKHTQRRGLGRLPSTRNKGDLRKLGPQLKHVVFPLPNKSKKSVTIRGIKLADIEKQTATSYIRSARANVRGFGARKKAAEKKAAEAAAK